MAPSQLPGLKEDGLYCSKFIAKGTVVCAYDFINGLNDEDGKIPKKTKAQLKEMNSTFTHVHTYYDSLPYNGICGKANGFYSDGFAKRNNLPLCGIKPNDCNLKFNGKYMVAKRDINPFTELLIVYNWS